MKFSYKMPRTYIRKTEINSYSLETLKKALHDIRENHKKIREVGRIYGIPESTLRKQLSASKPSLEPMGRKPLFTAENELELRDYILNLSKLFYRLTQIELRRLAYKYAEEKQIKNSFNKELGLAGKDWLYYFLKRHPEIDLRPPDGTSVNTSGFNKEHVERFYKNVEELFERHPFSPGKIYNEDEIGIPTKRKKFPKVKRPKESKKVRSDTSGGHVTVLFAANAAGNFIPPLFVFPRRNISTELQKNGPIGAVYTCSANGWSNEDIFLQWLSHFKTHAQPTESEPVLLILDDDSSHISAEIYDFCKKNFIYMVSLPPYTSHLLQPLDLAFFDPFKNALRREYDCHMKYTGNKKVTESDVEELLNKAFVNTAIKKNAISGFSAAGIFPLDPNKFSENELVSKSTENGEENFMISCETLPNEYGSDDSISCSVSRNRKFVYRDISVISKPSATKDNSCLEPDPVPVKKMKPMPSEKITDSSCDTTPSANCVQTLMKAKLP